MTYDELLPTLLLAVDELTRHQPVPISEVSPLAVPVTCYAQKWGDLIRVVFRSPFIPDSFSPSRKPFRPSAERHLA